MSKLEVIVAAMNQIDFSLVEKLNINCDVVIANQSDNNSYYEAEMPNGKARMVSTTTRGVGVNRNLGLAFSEGDILMLADDDLVYNDDMPEKVEGAFNELEKADVIIFGTFFSKKGEVYKKNFCKTKKLSILKSMRYGTYAVAIRKFSLKRANLSFSELFGGGCIYSHGEDSDFIINCYKRGLKVYTYDYVLGVTAKDSSTWFTGFNEKYFYDTGALAKNTFGIFAVPYMLRLALRTEAEEGITFKKKMDLMMAGYRNFRNLVSYDEWKKGKNNE